MKTKHLTQNCRKLWDSAEMKQMRGQMAQCGVLYGLLILICGFGSHWRIALPVLAADMALCILPVLAIWLWKAFCILHDPEDYVFCTTRLYYPSSVLLDRGSFSLTGVIDNAGGSPITVQTHPVFLSRGPGVLRMEEYADQTVTLGYNPRTHEVVVIG